MGAESATGEIAPGEEEREGQLMHVDDIGPGESILLAGPLGTDSNDQYCGSLLAQSEPETLNVVLVTLLGDPAERIATVTEHLGGDPGTTAVVTAGGSDVATAADGSLAAATIETVADPGDLPQLGLTISGTLADLDDDRPTVFCLHSVTTLLQYVDLQRVYRFLHTLMGRLRSVDTVSHYHIDPAAHDEQTMATLRPLFDRVVETDSAAE